jgi:hypothetical protein
MTCTTRRGAFSGIAGFGGDNWTRPAAGANAPRWRVGSGGRAPSQRRPALALAMTVELEMAVRLKCDFVHVIWKARKIVAGHHPDNFVDVALVEMTDDADPRRVRRFPRRALSPQRLSMSCAARQQSISGITRSKDYTRGCR